MAYNPFLKKRALGARGGVEKRDNVAWQHRAEPPTDFENRLGDALEQIFARSIEHLPDIVRELNRITQDADGKAWTEESFLAQMKRLGA